VTLLLELYDYLYIHTRDLRGLFKGGAPLIARLQEEYINIDVELKVHLL
jgi:hypothetical protein